MIHKPAIQKAFIFLLCLFWAVIFGLLLRAAIAAAPQYPAMAILIGVALVGVTSWMASNSLK